MKSKDFVVFIPTNGRPDRVVTYKTLRKLGYTGEIKLIVDDLDGTIDEYKEKYGNDVIVFDKKKEAETTDTGDNIDDLRIVLYARNACFRIAKEIGYRYFIVLDDDYTTLAYKFDSDLKYKENRIKNLDSIFLSVFKFLNATPSKAVAFAQNGDFIGGAKGSFGKEIKLRRKCMNSFFCDTEKAFKYYGRINEDVNVYTREAISGSLFFTIPMLSLNQKQTQKNSGGLTDIYLDMGTYIKSFYSVMYAPSAVTVAMMGDKHMRLHHRVRWKNATPMILSEDLRK